VWGKPGEGEGQGMRCVRCWHVEGGRRGARGILRRLGALRADCLGGKKLRGATHLFRRTSAFVHRTRRWGGRLGVKILYEHGRTPAAGHHMRWGIGGGDWVAGAGFV
jgi:hypothetical protein